MSGPGLVGPIPEIEGGALGRKAIPPRVIANDHVEHGDRCESGGGADCFLTPPQRTRARNTYEGNVGAAQIQYGDAIEQLRAESANVPPEDVPIFVSLAIGALSTLAGTAVTKALAGKSSPQEVFGSILTGVWAGESETAMDAVRAANPAWVIKEAIDAGKKAAVGTLKEQKDGETIDYISKLVDASAMAFESLRQVVFNDDADLLRAMHSFSASMGHTKSQYYAAIKAKVSRWTSSGASRVGRRFSKDETKRNVVRDTKLVLFRYPDDPEEPPRLMLYKRDYNKVWFQPDDMEKTREPLRDDLENEAYDANFVEWKPVEEEFVQEAIAKNRESWGTDYEIRNLYDSTPSRYMKAATK